MSAALPGPYNDAVAQVFLQSPALHRFQREEVIEALSKAAFNGEWLLSETDVRCLPSNRTHADDARRHNLACPPFYSELNDATKEP